MGGWWGVGGGSAGFLATRRNADKLISIKAGGLTGMITAG